MLPFYLPLGFNIHHPKALLYYHVDAQIRVSDADSGGGLKWPQRDTGLQGDNGALAYCKEQCGKRRDVFHQSGLWHQ